MVPCKFPYDIWSFATFPYNIWSDGLYATSISPPRSIWLVLRGKQTTRSPIPLNARILFQNILFNFKEVSITPPCHFIPIELYGFEDSQNTQLFSQFYMLRDVNLLSGKVVHHGIVTHTWNGSVLINPTRGDRFCQCDLLRSELGFPPEIRGTIECHSGGKQIVNREDFAS